MDMRDLRDLAAEVLGGGEAGEDGDEEGAELHLGTCVTGGGG